MKTISELDKREVETVWSSDMADTVANIQNREVKVGMDHLSSLLYNAISSVEKIHAVYNMMAFLESHIQNLRQVPIELSPKYVIVPRETLSEIAEAMGDIESSLDSVCVNDLNYTRINEIEGAIESTASEVDSIGCTASELATSLNDLISESVSLVEATQSEEVTEEV